MNARTIRRAAERKARKLALKSAKEHEQLSHSPAESSEEQMPVQSAALPGATDEPITAARLAANRANAQRSTGPKTEAGRKRSSLNAVKTALTGRTVLLPTDDVNRYETLVANWQAELQPEGPRECALVQSIADSHWRTDRILRLEFALYAEGREQFGSEFAHLSATEAISRIEANTYLAYEKQLRNLSVQEARLRRQREKDLAELKHLQEERRARTAAEDAARQKKQLSKPNIATRPTTNGFVFASEQSNSILQSETSRNATTNTINEERSLAQVA